MATIKTWFLETRPPFLLLSVVLAFLGTSIAWYDGYFNLRYALLAFGGLLLAHIGVNMLNDYFDYRSGIDLKTERTPFSGGSGILPAGLLKPRQVFWAGITCALLAIPIGAYFVLTVGWLLLPLLIVGAVCIFLYSPFILKLRCPEWSPGLGLGALPILGFYFVQTAAYTWTVAVVAVVSGILVHNLLLLNEFPDTEPDRKAGRKTLPIILGKRKAGIVYSVLTVVVYSWIIGSVVAGYMPVFALIALGTLPFAVKAVWGALKPQDMDTLMPGIANSVRVNLLTQLLLGVGYILARVF